MEKENYSKITIFQWGCKTAPARSERRLRWAGFNIGSFKLRVGFTNYLFWKIVTPYTFGFIGKKTIQFYAGFFSIGFMIGD